MRDSKQKNEVDLYLVKTPRQWLLSHVLIEQRKQLSIVVISDGFDGAIKLQEVNESLNSDLIESSFLISGKLTFAKQENNGFIKKNNFWKAAKRQLENISNQYVIKTVFSANPASVQLQYLHFLNPNSAFHVVDDGLETYRPKTQKNSGKISLLVKSMKYGFPFKTPMSGFIFDYFESGWFFEPAKVDERFYQVKLNEIDRDLFKSPRLMLIKNRVIKKFRVELDGLASQKVVIVLSRTSYLQESCENFSVTMMIDRIKNYLSNSEWSESKVFIKYHPREQEKDIYGFKENLKDVEFIPQTIPFELLYDSIDNQDLVIGEVSTALFDIALNKPNTRIVSIACSSINAEVKSKLIDSGVEVLSD